VRRGRIRWWSLPVLALLLGLGCSIAPKSFRNLAHPAPIVRARAVGLGNGLPDSQVVPALIEHLDDPDAVVRLSAHEELRKRTGQNFGFVPWADNAERAPAVTRWRDWWNRRKAPLAKSGRIP
jgi:HEAT repeat protein